MGKLTFWTTSYIKLRQHRLTDIIKVYYHILQFCIIKSYGWYVTIIMSQPGFPYSFRSFLVPDLHGWAIPLRNYLLKIYSSRWKRFNKVIIRTSGDFKHLITPTIPAINSQPKFDITLFTPANKLQAFKCTNSSPSLFLLIHSCESKIWRNVKRMKVWSAKYFKVSTLNVSL